MPHKRTERRQCDPKERKYGCRPAFPYSLSQVLMLKAVFSIEVRYIYINLFFSIIFNHDLSKLIIFPIFSHDIFSLQTVIILHALDKQVFLTNLPFTTFSVIKQFCKNNN